MVNCYLGDDEYLDVLVRAHRQAETDPEGGLALIAGKIAELEAAGVVTDDAEVVHRTFDSYASRLVYNLVRAGSFPAPDGLFGRADVGKRVELIPDSVYLCYIEAERMLERSFNHTEEAIAYGKRAIELAPTVATAYRQLARVYMLVGDMSGARALLDRALAVASSPADVAVAYYQLGYVLWKSGSPKPGALCYLKSIATSPFVAMQAAAELNELVHEETIDVIERDELDERLQDEGILIAPSARVLDALLEGAAAATDAGMFPVARNLLSLRIHYEPDDALVGVLRSLGEDVL